MDVISSNKIYQKKIKSFLVFFCVLFLFSCHKWSEPIAGLSYSENGSAISVVFSGKPDAGYQIKLKGKGSSIFGELAVKNGENIFTPIIPFSAGESYEIYKDDVLYLSFSVPKLENQVRPKLISIYPAIDTVPENLLKMYFVFSKPMQQSQSFLDFITITNKETNKIENIFLPLENELWNTDHTELTLWLDPGRIKKDLIPNKELGIPVKKGNTYEITIPASLTDADGVALGKDYQKTIVVGERDAKSPSISKWELTIPQENTKEALGISFQESLDAMLSQETIQIVTDKNKIIDGGFMLSKKATSILFVPKVLWKKGAYKIVIESKLEDLAGNNLNRLFDTDLSKNEKVSTSKTKEISFTIQ
tara:strand:+ start:46635 stop:47723 length:1089 start_codon:yes stop_codon:yes gene_type:complete